MNITGNRRGLFSPNLNVCSVLKAECYGCNNRNRQRCVRHIRYRHHSDRRVGTHAETIPRRKVSAWLFVGVKYTFWHIEKLCCASHKETNKNGTGAENPCAISIFRKRISLIVSIPMVSKLSDLFGGGEGNRTPVRNHISANVYECMSPIKIPDCELR